MSSSFIFAVSPKICSILGIIIFASPLSLQISCQPTFSCVSRCLILQLIAGIKTSMVNSITIYPVCTCLIPKRRFVFLIKIHLFSFHKKRLSSDSPVKLKHNEIQKVLPTPRQNFAHLFHYENFIYHKMTRIATILQLFVDKIRFYKLLCFSIVQNKSSNRFFRSFRIYSNHWILREIKWRILKT